MLAPAPRLARPRSSSVPRRPRPGRGGPLTVPARPEFPVLRVPRTFASRAGIEAPEDRVGAEPDLGVRVATAPEQPALIRRRRLLEALGGGIALAPGRIPQALDQAAIGLGRSPGSWILDRGLWILDSGSRNLESKIVNPRSKVH